MGTSLVANAQRNREDDRNRQDDQRNERRINQQQKKIDMERAKAEKRRVSQEQQRRNEWNRQNARRGGNGVYVSPNVVQTNRYRVYRNGSYYNTDNRGAEMLRQAVNSGYQQGYQAGQYDRNNRRRSIWTTNNVYRNGNYGYSSGVDRGQYQYYFQQGFQRGYQDGYYSRNVYGNGGSLLGNILGAILDIRVY